jgi:biotin carboxyl carrier protein
MPYLATVNKHHYRIETHEEQQSVTLDGVVHALDWRQLAPLAADAKGNVGVGGHYSLLINGASFDIFARRIIKPDEQDSQTYEVQIAGHRFEVKVEDERARLLAGLVKGSGTGGMASVYAPMPGLVVGVPVEIGQNVNAGQPVLILEAMKMENDLTAPISGIVKEVHARKGQAVEQGAMLVVIEAQEE